MTFPTCRMVNVTAVSGLLLVSAANLNISIPHLSMSVMHYE
jgi:hypothetical protein